MAKTFSGTPVLVGMILFVIAVAVVCNQNDPFDKKPPVFTTPSAAPSNMGE